MTVEDLNLGILEFGYSHNDGRLRSGLEFTLKLAKIAEECGYSRFWFTEHHSSNLGIASPEVVIAAVAAQTGRIRVGSAGILLSYYSPFKIAETFHTLATLFPGRIDLGLARGLGAGQEVIALLRDGQPEPTGIEEYTAIFERKTEQLFRQVRDGYEAQRKLPSEAPLADLPEFWLHGSGTGSAALAAKLGANLTIALWYESALEIDIRSVLADYRARFEPSADGRPAKACIFLSGICAETDREAEAMLAAAKERLNPKLIANFCGSPERCRDTILELAAHHGVRDVVIHAQFVLPDHQERMFRMLADVIIKGKTTVRAPSRQTADLSG